MRATVRILAVLGALAALGAVLAVATAAYFWVHDGTIEVRVIPKTPAGDDVSIRLPGVLARAAVGWIPNGAVRLDDEALEALPIAREALARLERCPDATFVETVSGREHVVVSKRGGRLLVEVETAEESVRIAVPLSVAGAALRAVTSPRAL